MFDKIFKLDWILIGASLLLLAIGLSALYSISVSAEGGFRSDVFARQAVFAVIGVITMTIFSFLDYRYFQSHSKWIYFFMLLILISVLLVGSVVRGTVGWISIGSFHIQPVELAKVLLILSLASFITKSKNVLDEVLRIIVTFALAGVAIILVLKQPDFGSALVLMFISSVMLLLSGIEWKYLLGLFFIGIVVMTITWFFLADYQKDRLINFVNPANDPKGSGYNVNQSIIAVGSGQLFGKGLGHGSQSQLNFLPESHTDFIFAVIAEEFGAFGSAIILFLLGVIFYRMKKIAEHSADNFGYLIVVGAMAMFFIQIIINIGMNIGIMPVTGIPLIFISYGGSSLISSFMIIGIVNNIYLVGKKKSIVKSAIES